VYSWDGQEYQLDSQILTNSPLQELEGTDYDNLEYLTPNDGEYLLKLTEEMEEIAYFDELKLIVVDHPSGTQIIPDSEGNIHTIQSPYAPIAAEEFDGPDCWDKVKERDGVFWTSNMENKDFSQNQDLRDGIILRFNKPAGATTAKVAVRFQHTDLLEFIGGHIGKLPLCDSDQCRRLRSQLRHIHLSVWNGTEWVHEGPFTRYSTVTTKEDIRFIDVSGITDDEIRIRLGSLTGLVLIDSVVVDYLADESVITTELSTTTAVDADGVDIAPQILSDDDDYLVLEQGDYAHLSFNEVEANPGYDRSYVVKAKGYYDSPVTPLEGEVPQERLEQFLADFRYAMRYFLERYHSPNGHCGIDLYYSSANIILGNEIYDNEGDGISLYYSDNNRIMDNDVHGNYGSWWYFYYWGGNGIYLEYSNNNRIIKNTVYDNEYGIGLDYSDDNEIL